ncbi:MAG: putative DNA binding domain-containing protein [Candidatus Sumerlaeia bacterium]|nr:putative DNA binding domain-containing protein [Candidatus Sumerlaeia bacterium]
MTENQHTEWKESWRDEHLKWVSAFANAEGGTLVIGRNDKGEAVGVPRARKLLEDLPNKIRDMLGIMVDVNLIKENGRELIVIVVESYPYPVSYKGEYHYRSGTTKQVLKGAALDQFLLRKQGKHWDGVPLPGLKVDALSTDAITTFRRLARKSSRLDSDDLDEERGVLLEKLHLYEDQYLKRAASLLFFKEPEKFTSGAFTKIAFFRSNTNLLFQDVVSGNLFDQALKTFDLLETKYLISTVTYQGIQRRERLPIPKAALREAVLNALVHKNYGVATPVQISVYSDRLIIWNPGELPANWTPERLKSKHPSIPYNPAIAHTFFLAGLIEAWGRGFEKIYAACAIEGLPEPRIKKDSEGLWIELQFPEVDEKWDRNWEDVGVISENGDENEAEWDENAAQRDENEEKWDENEEKWDRNREVGDENEAEWDENFENGDENEAEWDEKFENGDEKREDGDEKLGETACRLGETAYRLGETAERLGEKLGENKAAILLLMLESPKISSKRVAEKLDLSVTAIENNVQKLKADGWLERVGPAKGGHWKVLLERLEEGD